MNAVDVAIASVEAVPTLLDFTSELQTSLAVRRAYGKFRARILAGGDPTPDTLRARFRGAGTHIAKLVGWDIYPEMRVQDRLLLRELQQRVLDWLRGGPEATSAAGVRLWQDLTGCLQMFLLVNRRQELVEHDTAIVRALAAQVEASELDASAWASVRALEGLDPELDQLLTGAVFETSALRPIVRRIAMQLGTTSTFAGGDVPW
jgi:hypothetical protein